MPPFFSASGRRPPPPGPRGRILFVGAFNGGVGGVERLTRSFATWVEGSGYSAVMIFRHPDLGAGPNRIEGTERVTVAGERGWNRALATADYDFVYLSPPGLDHGRWIRRLADVRGTRVVLDLDPKREWLPVTDVLHCEAPREEPLPRPHVVATPDPRPTIAEPEPGPEHDFHLTVFNPYGQIKGQRHLPAFLDATERPLVWCYDPATFAGRSRRSAQRLREAVAAVTHPRLTIVESPSPARLYGLYARCAGYVCFSDSEGLGWSLLDALVLDTPICARRVGICRAVSGFEATEDFGRPVFRRYAAPPTPGFGAVFDRARDVLAGRA